MSDLDVSPDLAQARAEAIRARLDGSAGAAGVLKLFGGTKPEAGAAASNPLVTIPLAYPCGEATAAGLTLTLPPDAQVSAAGTITWGRFEDSAGAWIIDARAELGSESATAAIQLDRVVVYPGATVSVLEIVFA